MPSPTPSAKPSRTPLTRDRVLTAAAAYADEHGLDALSMRKLGDALGVRAMSLYNHVANKDDILDGLLDLAVAEIEVPSPGGDWKDAMRRRARSAYEVFIRHPWAPTLITGRPTPGPAMLRYLDATLGILRGAGFSIETVDHAWNAIDSHIYGYTLQELNFPFERETVSEVAAAYLPHFPKDELPHLFAMTNHTATTDYDGRHDLEFGLNLILDGLERLLPTE